MIKAGLSLAIALKMQLAGVDRARVVKWDLPLYSNAHVGALGLSTASGRT